MGTNIMRWHVDLIHHWRGNGLMPMLNYLRGTTRKNQNKLITMTSHERHGVSIHRKVQANNKMRTKAPYHWPFERGFHKSIVDSPYKWSVLLNWPVVKGMHRSRWIPLTKASDAELWCFLRSLPQQTVEQTIETLVIWDAMALIMISL